MINLYDFVSCREQMSEGLCAYNKFKIGTEILVNDTKDPLLSIRFLNRSGGPMHTFSGLEANWVIEVMAGKTKKSLCEYINDAWFMCSVEEWNLSIGYDRFVLDYNIYMNKLRTVAIKNLNNEISSIDSNYYPLEDYKLTDLAGMFELNGSGRLFLVNDKLKRMYEIRNICKKKNVKHVNRNHWNRNNCYKYYIYEYDSKCNACRLVGRSPEMKNNEEASRGYAFCEFIKDSIWSPMEKVIDLKLIHEDFDSDGNCYLTDTMLNIDYKIRLNDGGSDNKDSGFRRTNVHYWFSYSGYKRVVLNYLENTNTAVAYGYLKNSDRFMLYQYEEPHTLQYFGLSYRDLQFIYGRCILINENENVMYDIRNIEVHAISSIEKISGIGWLYGKCYNSVDVEYDSIKKVLKISLVDGLEPSEELRDTCTKKHFESSSLSFNDAGYCYYADTQLCINYRIKKIK